MRAAIIGLGVIGKVHYTVLSAQGEEIVALCDVDPNKLSGLVGEKYSDWKKMLDETRPDVVHVCTPHYLHADMVVYALDHGINVLCEKPLCIKSREIEKILDAEKRSSARLGVCFQNRYNETSRYIKDYLADKEIDSAEGIVNWHRDEGYYRSAPWRGKWATEGGGVLINQAIHTVDLLLWIVGMPVEVSAVVKNKSLKNVIEVEDTADLTCFGEQDFSVHATNAAPVDCPVELRFSAEREEIVVTPTEVSIDGKQVAKEALSFYGKESYGSGHAKIARHFYDCVKSGKKFPIDGQEGAKAVRVVLAAYRSRGERVDV